MMRLYYAVAAAICLAGSVQAATAPDIAGSERIEAMTLENGLKIIVWPDFDIPNVAWYHWVRAGSRNEYPGITGLSHFFEHMMFNGTSRREPGEFDRIMESNGGANNAYTSSDVTVYTDWVPAAALEVTMDLESDRFQNLAFVPEVVESERGVVYSERRSSLDNQNINLLYEQVQATAFVAHPYQFPTIGWPSDIENWTLEDLQTFFKTYYAPNNTTLVIAGAVRPVDVFELAERYFGRIPAQPEPAPIRTTEPPQQGQRRLEIRKPGQTPIIETAFHIPRGSDPEMPAMVMLMDILATGSSSRLHQRLVEQEQLVVEVDSYHDEGFDPGLAWLFAILPPGGDLERVEEVLFEELDRIAADGVSAAELAKARNIQLAKFWRKLATIDGKADLLGTYEVFHGDFRKLLEVPMRFEAVTAERIQKLAARVFRKQNSTVGLLIPEDSETEEGS
jgi:zinc protease